MKAINLKTEYLTNPIGIDVDYPRLMWNCEDGITQTAYQIIAENPDGELLWDSGKVISSKMTFIKYPVYTFPRCRVYWRVKLWDENDSEGEFSSSAFFEIGLKRAGDFCARWISGDYTPDKKTRYPVDCFKKEFKAETDVKSARIYASACGIYSCFVNGVKISMPLAPGVTDYRKRIQYQTYDVTDLIKKNNVITAELADGWYRGSVGAWGITNQYGTQTKLYIQLEIIYKNGKKQIVKTDNSWRWSNDGAVRFADNKDGEIVDGRMRPSYSGNARFSSCSVIPSASNNVPIAEKEIFKGEMHVSPSGKRIIDFKQNFAGYISFAINAKQGQRITLRFGELLDSAGELTLKNIQCTSKKKTTPLQTIEYVCHDGLNEYKTAFAIFGFRYAEIDTDIDIMADNFTAVAVYSDMEETGFFDSSNDLLNKFVNASKWSAKSNSTDLPTDCPTRERHGWTGDAQIFFETASYLFNYAPFSQKYLNDVYDWQKRNGKLPQIAPPGGVDFYMSAMDGSAGWADAGILIPYRFWKKYNDIDIIKKYYGRMKLYAGFVRRRCGRPYPTAKYVSIPIKYRRYLNNCGQAYGEWAEPTDVNPQNWATCVITHPETATAYTSCIMECMAQMADAIGEYEDAVSFRNFSLGNKKAYQALMRSGQYSLDTDRQSQLARALYFDMLDDMQSDYAKHRLIEALRHYNWRVGTGFLSTPLILYVLSDIDVEYAYKLLENEEMPGWLYMTKSGAVTVWESWEGTHAQNGIASLNHYSKGAVCEWLFKSMCGINIVSENHFVIKPLPGGSFSYANAEYISIFGTVKSGWRKDNGKYLFSVDIPSNCTADVILPDNRTYNLKSGHYDL